jgi:hypothetical protein
VVFLKYITLKTYLVFSANYSKNTIFKVRLTAFIVGYFGRVLFKVVLALPVLHSQITNQKQDTHSIYWIRGMDMENYYGDNISTT